MALMSVCASSGIGACPRFNNAPIYAGSGIQSLGAGDFNRDGHKDLAIVRDQRPEVLILLGTGAGSFGEPTQLATGTSPVSLAIGDFNGDAKDDLAVGSFNFTPIVIFWGKGDGTFDGPTDSGFRRWIIFLSATDFNQDGKDDLLVGTKYLGKFVYALVSRGDGTFWGEEVSDARTFTAGDFNGDGKDDLALASWAIMGPPEPPLIVIAVILGKGGDYFRGNQIGMRVDIGGDPTSLAAADFNGDGRDDLAIAVSVPASDSAHGLAVLLGNGDGSFGPATNYATGAASSSTAIADFNGDQLLDIAVASSGSNSVSILVGEGDGTFTPGGDQSVGGVLGPGIGMGPFMTLEDFNGDDLSDIAVAGPEQVSLLLNGCRPPVCRSISPTRGSILGGEVVTITGSRLLGATTVTFGGLPAPIDRTTESSVTVRAPAHPSGSVDVIVRTTDGAGVLRQAFQYVGEREPPSKIPAFSATALLLLSALLGLLGAVTLRR